MNHLYLDRIRRNISRSASTILRWIIEPSAIVEERQRRRLRLLSAFLILLIFNTLAGVIVIRNEGISLWTIMLATTIILVFGYVLSRTRYYKIATVIAVTIPAFPSIAAIIFGANEKDVMGQLAWLAMPLLIAGLLFSLRNTLIIAVSYLAVIILLIPLAGISTNYMGESLAFAFMISFFVVAVTTGFKKDQFEIEHQLTERTRAEEALQDKTKELEQIVYIASHDLRSPLVNIQGFTKELENSVDEIRVITNNGDTPPEMKEKLAVYMEEDIPEALNFVLAGTAKIDTLLSGLLRLSRLGKAALDIQTLNMDEILRDISQTLEFTLKNLKINLEVEDLPDCRGDKIQINQVFSNLIDNAIKYRDLERDCTIRITGETLDGQAVFCVEDNGIGIAEEHQKKVFEIFQRIGIHKSTGEGLGLSIVRRILDRHSGKVWLESDPGKGSKFFISLPAGNIANEGVLHYADSRSGNTYC